MPLAAPLMRLLGQHPAAVRTVSFSEAPFSDGQLCHLEIETKHGHVLVIDHVSGRLLEPAQSSADGGRRCQRRDLTAELPVAFDGRPRFESISPLGDDKAPNGWRFALSTGATFSFHLDPESPRLSVTKSRSGPRRSQ